jgi:hypothetical protein
LFRLGLFDDFGDWFWVFVGYVFFDEARAFEEFCTKITLVFLNALLGHFFVVEFFHVFVE